MSSILALPDYRLWRWECFKADPDSEDQKLPWFNLFVGMPQGRFKLTVSRGDFNKSHDKLAEFDRTLSFLQMIEINTSILLLAAEAITEVNKAVEWIIPSLLDEIRNRGSAGELPPSQESLEEFWSRPWTLFAVAAEENELVLEGGEPVIDTWPPSLEFCTGHQLVPNGDISRGPLSVLGSSDITVRARDEAAVVADEPRVGFLAERAANMVRFDPGDRSKVDYPLAVRSLAGLSPDSIQNIIDKHNFLSQLADGSPPADDPDRASSLPHPPQEPIAVLRPLFLVARGQTTVRGVPEGQGVFGLGMEHPGAGTTTLREALASGRAPVERRLLWKKALVRAVARMHAAGVVWGDVRLESVLVRGDRAWIYRLGSRYHLEKAGGRVGEEGLRMGTGGLVAAVRVVQRAVWEAAERVQEDAKALDVGALGTLFLDPLWGPVGVNLAELYGDDVKSEVKSEVKEEE